MKRAIWAVIAIGFLVVSCGGGNVTKVKNGVFPDVDSTITVGQAFANDATLKGGDWKTYKNEGREIVSYTVQFTPSQINAQRNRDKERPNFTVANQIFSIKNIAGWDYVFQRLQPFEKEEQQQFRAVFEPAFTKASRAPEERDFFDLYDYSKYLDPWIMERLDSFSYVKKELLSRDAVIRMVLEFIRRYNGNNFYGAYNAAFKLGYDINYDGVPEFETALKNSAANYAEQSRIANEKLEAAIKAWESKDIDPLITVNRGSVTFFFVIDQANKDAFNIAGMYFEEDLTLNCLNNKKVTWQLEYTTPNKILEYIYKPKSRGFDFL
jgi:hypothetical protein